MDIYRKISPHPSLPKRGIIPPFGKGRSGGILQINVVTIIRLLITLFLQRLTPNDELLRHFDLCPDIEPSPTDNRAGWALGTPLKVLPCNHL